MDGQAISGDTGLIRILKAAGVMIALSSACLAATARPRTKKWRFVMLCKANELKGYTLSSLNGKIGAVKEFYFDDRHGTIRYLVVDTRNWWPGKKVLVSPQWIERVSWSESKIHVDLPLEAIKQSPEYTEEFFLTRDYETLLLYITIAKCTGRIIQAAINASNNHKGDRDENKNGLMDRSQAGNCSNCFGHG